MVYLIRSTVYGLRTPLSRLKDATHVIDGLYCLAQEESTLGGLLAKGGEQIAKIRRLQNMSLRS
jgi:hypothetical protein